MPERIHVVGVGPDGLPPRAEALARRAALVVGAGRHLDRLTDAAPPGASGAEESPSNRSGPGHPSRPGQPSRPGHWVRLGPLAPALDAIAACDGEVLVLASGDPGWFGIVRALAHRFGDDLLDVAPAASSVATAFARLGRPWDDAVVVSAHGRDPRPAVAAALAHPVVAVLTAPDFTPVDLARALADAGAGDRRLAVAERLGTPDERMVAVTAGAPGGPYADPNVVVVRAGGEPVDPAPRALVGAPPPPHGWALPTSAFDHRDGMVSKPEVRALALAHLAPRTGRLVWDVGAGCGSVAVECARFGAATIAVERDADQVERCRRNALAHRVAVRAVTGTAPAALADLPDADATFVGGGGASLGDILDVVAARTRDRIVVALASIERVTPALERLTGAGWTGEAQLVQVHDLGPLGAGHRLVPRNPVWLVTAARTENAQHA